MKALLNTIDGPKINIDLSEVASIEQYGQRDSIAGYVNVKLTLKSGIIINANMTPENYDQLVIDWNPQ